MTKSRALELGPTPNAFWVPINVGPVGQLLMRHTRELYKCRSMTHECTMSIPAL